MAPAEFVMGSAAALEDALTEAIVAGRRDDPLAPVTVLVGHTLLKRYVPRMLAARGHAHLNVRCLRPAELAEELAAAASDPPRPRVTPGVERLLVREVAASAGGYFAGIAGGDGFADALRRLFRELEMGGFDDAASLTEAFAAQPNADVAKFDELSRLYGEYLRRREEAGIAGPADAYRLADPVRFEGPLLVYGMWSASELQARLIERVAEHHAVTIFLPQSGLAADEAHAALRERLGAVGRTSEGRGRRRFAILPKEATRDDIQSFLDTLMRDDNASVATQRLFREPTGEPMTVDGIELVSAPDTVREAWEAARTCLRWAEEGIAFHEMAVVYRNREPYRALIDEIFSEARIPTYLHDGRLFSTHPLGLRLLALLDLVADEEFPRRKVMEFLTETRIPRGTRDAYRGISPSMWEAYTREAGIVGGIDQWRRRLERLAAEKREFAEMEGREWQRGVADRIDVLRKFIEDLHEALTSRSADGTWDEHLAFVRGLAERYAEGLEPVLDELADLRAMAAVAPRVSFEEFCRAVRDDLENRDVTHAFGEPVRMFGRRGVAVIDALSLRHLSFRAVYMVGAAERSWPPPVRPDPLLLEHERAHLNAAAADRAIPLRTAPDSETLTFWTGVQAVRERLTISYARADAGSTGKHLPSYFFRAVAEALLGRRLTLEEMDASGVVRRFAAGRLANDDIASSLSKAEYDRGLIKSMLADGTAAAAAALTRVTPSFGRAITSRDRRWAPALSPFDGVMESADALARTNAIAFGRERAVSPSRLETYATCPYRFFLRYVLSVDPIEEPDAVERLDARERGSLIHEILERFLAGIGRDDPPHADARTRHIAGLLDVAHEVGRDREERGVTGLPLIWALDQQRIHADLIRWYDEEVREADRTAFRPGAFEVSFGSPGYGFGTGDTTISAGAPVVLRAGDREVRLQGRIDRVDWDDARSRFRVIDYKTGRREGPAAFRGGQRLQLALYIQAAAQLLGLPVESGEAQYFYVSSKGGFKRTPITGHDLQARSDDLDRIFSTIAEGVDGGYFAPSPGPNKDHCRYCDYRDVCDARIDRVMSRKEGDPRGAAFISMTEIQ